MITAVYEQSSGLFVLDAPLNPRWVGYAGRGIGRNNPNMESIRNTGPLPAGLYRVGLPFHHERLGPLCFRLTPALGTNLHGRSGFLIHGDNARGDASEGCIVLPREARERIAALRVDALQVVRLLPVAIAKDQVRRAAA